MNQQLALRRKCPLWVSCRLSRDAPLAASQLRVLRWGGSGFHPRAAGFALGSGRYGTIGTTLMLMRSRAFKTLTPAENVQREVTSRGYHFLAVYTKVSRHYPKSQVTRPNI